MTPIHVFKLRDIFNEETVDRLTHDPEKFYEEAPANVKRILDGLMDQAFSGVDREEYSTVKKPTL